MAGTNMTKPTSRKKRNKLITVLLAPLLIIAFIVGWSLSWIGQSGQTKANQPQKPTNKTLAEQNEVELIMIDQEEQILTN
jgi:flagellar basal body-associated protein FliL